MLFGVITFFLEEINTLSKNILFRLADSVERTEIMRIAERRALGPAPASRRTYFGDGPWDKKASLELGYDFVAVGRRVAHDLAFENLGDLGAILEQLGL